MADATQLRPRFDPTINWGHVLILSGFLMTALAGWTTFQRGMDNHALRIDSLEKSRDAQAADVRRMIELLSEVRTDIAVMKTQGGITRGRSE